MDEPWHTLGIEPTDDRKVIKRAYAVLLKQFRPEESPEQFQAINEAYQSALMLAENQTTLNPSDVQDLSNEVFGGLYPEAIEGFDQIEINADSDNPAMTMAQGILDQFDETAFADSRTQNKLSNWKFLEDFRSIEDLQVRDQLSRELFSKVVAYNKYQLKTYQSLLIPQPVVQYMAEVLDWESNWQSLQGHFSEAQIDHVFKLLTFKPRAQGLKSLLLRLFSLGLDMLIALGLAKLISLRPWAPEYETIQVLAIFTFLVYNLGAIDKLGSLSLVQYIFGFRAFDPHLNPPRTKSEVTRAVVFHLTLMPVYFVYYDPAAFFDMMRPVVAALILVNTMLWFWRRQFLHDWLARVVLIK